MVSCGNLNVAYDIVKKNRFRLFQILQGHQNAITQSMM